MTVQSTKAKAVLPERPPGRWGLTDLAALRAWQGKRLEVHLITGQVLGGELCGYTEFTLLLKFEDQVVVVNKGGVVWYTEIKSANE